MLETRPVLQKSLIGLGAFSFIFFAAMGGTAFMISGGFGLSAPERAQASTARDYVNLFQEWATPQAEATTYAPASYAPTTPPADAGAVSDSTNYTDETLAAGDAQTSDRTEQEVIRDIDTEYAAGPPAEDPENVHPDESSADKYNEY